jgi:hypothetical protein
VELYSTTENRVKCTEGPFNLTAVNPAVTNIDIECGMKKETAAWLLAAAAGAAAVAAVATQSASR